MYISILTYKVYVLPLLICVFHRNRILYFYIKLCISILSYFVFLYLCIFIFRYKLQPSPQQLLFHSAVFLDHLMVVFGGTQVDDTTYKFCFSNTIFTYDTGLYKHFLLRV